MRFAVGALVCAAIYVGAYLALLKPDTYWFCSLGSAGSPYQREPMFLIGGDRAKTVFSLLLWLDHSVRPTYWSGVRLFDGTSVASSDLRASGLVQGGGFSGPIPSESSEPPK
jgi:hypothetical protein